MKKLKQIVCILCAVFLAGLYLVTLVFAFTDSSQARSWLSASLYATIAVPVFLYAFLLITKLLKNRNAGQTSEKPDPADSSGRPDRK